MKVISPKLHALLDYLTVIFLIAAPQIFFLSDVAKTIAYLLAGLHLLITICTNFTGGLFKVIPFKVHGLLEFFVALGLAIAAFTYFKHNKVDQNFLSSLGIVIMVVFLLTNYNQKQVK